jgi:hypothetical protein
MAENYTDVICDNPPGKKRSLRIYRKLTWFKEKKKEKKEGKFQTLCLNIQTCLFEFLNKKEEFGDALYIVSEERINFLST